MFQQWPSWHSPSDLGPQNVGWYGYVSSKMTVAVFGVEERPENTVENVGTDLGQGNQEGSPKVPVLVLGVSSLKHLWHLL